MGQNGSKRAKIGKRGPKQGQNSIKMDENRVKIGQKWRQNGANGSKWSQNSNGRALPYGPQKVIGTFYCPSTLRRGSTHVGM